MKAGIITIVALAAVLVSCESIGAPFAQSGGSSDQSDGGLSISVRPAGGASTGGAQAPASSQPAAVSTLSPAWSARAIDTASDAAYLTPTERQVITEINMVRTDPAEYARQFLVPLRAYFHGKMLKYPGEITIVTEEGASALEECIRVLESTAPVSPLSPKQGLCRAASDQVADQSRTGDVGHSGSDGSTPDTRIKRYGRWGGAMGENIDYGNADARRIVTSLLIDDGVPSRGHRSNLLDPDFKVIGVGIGTHPTYRYMCVMDFAGTFN